MKLHPDKANYLFWLGVITLYVMALPIALTYNCAVIALATVLIAPWHIVVHYCFTNLNNVQR